MKVLAILFLSLGSSLCGTTPLLAPPPIYSYAEIKRETPSFPGLGLERIQVRSSDVPGGSYNSYPYAAQPYPAQMQTFSIPHSEYHGRPIKYVPPRITFHPPKIIVSNTGVMYTQPSYSTGPAMINYSAPVQHYEQQQHSNYDSSYSGPSSSSSSNSNYSDGGDYNVSSSTTSRY